MKKMLVCFLPFPHAAFPTRQTAVVQLQTRPHVMEKALSVQRRWIHSFGSHDAFLFTALEGHIKKTYRTLTLCM
jgi:hypothetical protein